MLSCVSAKKNAKRISQASSLKMKTSSQSCQAAIVEVEVEVEVEDEDEVEVEVEVVDLATIALDHLFEMV